jgi:type II secretory pathway component PulF
MERFAYKAYDAAGALKLGEIAALDTESAKFKLKEQGLIPVTIKAIDERSARIQGLFKIRRRPRLSDLEFFTSKMSILLKNGIKVDRAFDITRDGIQNETLREIIGNIHEEIRRGTPLSAALEKYPAVFEPLYTGIVRIGEATGNLAEAFSDMADTLSFQRSIITKTQQALLYPAVIFFVCLGAVFFVFNFIVPKFSVIFAGIEQLPLYTNLLLSVSAFFRTYQFVLLMGLVLVIFAIRRMRKEKWVKARQDALVLKIPVVKDLFVTLENLRFASALAILLRSGVVLSDALDHAVRSVGNLFLQKRLLMVRNDVRQGKKLSETMAKTSFLPNTFDGLLEVGEQTGNLSEIFHEIESRLKVMYENKIAAFLTLIEPIMIILMGLVVGSVVVVMLLSMVSISDINF